MRAPVAVPPFDFRARITRAAAGLAAAGGDALLVSHLANLRYLSGLDASAGWGLLTAAGRLYLLVDPRYKAAAGTRVDEVGADTHPDQLVAHDLVFHRSLCELSGNAYLTSLLDSLSGSTLRARVWRGLVEDGAVERTLHEHRAIVDAVESGAQEVLADDWAKFVKAGLTLAPEQRYEQIFAALGG